MNIGTTVPNKITALSHLAIYVCTNTNYTTKRGVYLGKTKVLRNPNIISIYTEKAFDKIEHSFMIKTQQTRNRREFSQPDKEHP